MSCYESRYGSFALLAVALGCATDLTFDLEGKQCRATEPRCLTGFACGPDNTCVRSDTLSAGGSAGMGGNGAAAGSTSAGTGGASGQAGVGGRGVMGGTAGTAGAAAAGSSSDAGHRLDAGAPRDASAQQGEDAAAPDAPSDAAADACTPVVLYEDKDGDGYGSTDNSTVACPGPGWSETPGDCRDDLEQVHPNQAQYFGVGYSDPEGPAGVSFDYDCNNAEQASPSNNPSGASVNCASQLTCGAIGYQPTARSGTGILALCGSTIVIECTRVAAPCNNSASNTTAFACR